MSQDLTFEQRMQAIGILRWAASAASLIGAVICYVFLEGDLKRILPPLLVGVAVIEYFAFGAVARKMERKAQRDRG